MNENILYQHKLQNWLLSFAFILWMPIAVLAQDHADSDKLIPQFSSVTRASLKTVTFQAAANLSDTLIFSILIGTDATTNIAFLFANTATAMAVYFPYELIWDVFGPPSRETTTGLIAIKNGFYQTITGARNLTLSYAFSGSLLPSTTFVITAIAIDSVIYATNEYIWDNISPRTH